MSSEDRHDQRRPPPGSKISTVYAWVATEPDGTESLCSVQIGSVHYPMIGADKARIESYRPHAQQVTMATGYPVHMIEWTERRVLDTPFGPAAGGRA